MAQSAASYGEAVLHAPTGALHKDAFSDEAASFHSAMKHCSMVIPQYEALRLRSV